MTAKALQKSKHWIWFQKIKFMIKKKSEEPQKEKIQEEVLLL